jgi:hypothetical protein
VISLCGGPPKLGFRFQSRFKLFPGVRLNFSRGGISTTIGVRGASFTLGGRGAYVNLGIPGTGLSYREKITRLTDKPQQRSTPSSPDAAGQHEAQLPPPPYLPEGNREPPVAGAIRSAPVSAMTSAGLDELKKLINEAALKRIELDATVSLNEKALAREKWRLRLAQWFIVRLFTQAAIPKLVEHVDAAEHALAQSQQQLAGCSIEIDFAFDQSTLNAFAALVRSFDPLAKCQKKWDITASVLANRLVERTFAKYNITRQIISLGIKRSEIIDTTYDALYFSNANGTDIYIYPGFVMMPSRSKDFALIDVRELQVKCSESDYIEEESVPGDTATIGYTWKKANKDGSRDRRFANNHQLPIVKYAEIEFRSPTGLHEIYQFSNYTAAATVVESLCEYQTALAALAERSKDHSANPLLISSGDDSEDIEAEAAEATTAAPQALQPKAARFLIFDWLALVLLIAILVGTGLYFGLDFGRIQATSPVAQPRASSATPALVPPILPTPAASPPTPAASPPTPAATPSKPAATPPAPARATAPPPPIESVYVLRPRANVRSEPSSTSQVLSIATRGTRLTVFQRQGEWIQIGEGGPIGWVHQSLLATTPPP